MADNTASHRRKPQSLNDHHYRLLQDLSAAPKHPPSSSHGDDEGRKTSMIKLTGRRRLCKASSNEDTAGDDGNSDDDPDLADFDSPVKGDTVLERAGAGNNFTSWGDHKDGKAEVADEPNFSIITDFDSPSPQCKHKEERQEEEDGGRNEITDSLDDLTSMLGTMSIKKKKGSQRNDLDAGRVNSQRDDDGFESVKSSFSNISQSSSGVVSTCNVGVDYRKDTHGLGGFAVREKTTTNEFEGKRGEKFLNVAGQGNGGKPEEDRYGYNIDSRKGQYKEVDRSLKTTKHIEINEKLRSVGTSNAAKLKDLDDDDDDDDCVVLTGKKAVEMKSHLEKPKKPAQSYNINTKGYDKGVLEDEGSIIFTSLKFSYTLPGKIATVLYPHQREGLKWLWSLHTQEKGGILGDDMGLGKTMQICSFLAGLFHSKLIKRALVVAPKTLLPHWMKELATVGLSRMTREFYGNSTKAREYDLQHILQGRGVLLTTYDIVRNNTKSLQGGHHYNDEDEEDDEGMTWDYMILDEGHLIKNPNTQRAKSLLEIPSAHRIIISGTPIQNNLKELWALFNFSCPGLLGDKNWFKQNYEHYILRGTDKNATDREKRIGSTVAKNLREHIQPFFLRRLKSEVFGDDDANSKLSKKNEIVVWLRLTEYQRKLYKAFLNSEIVLSAFDGSPLAALTILKKICDHPLLLTKRAAEDVLEGMDATATQEEAGMVERLEMLIADNVDTADFQAKHDSSSCKLSFIMSLLKNLIPEGHHVLIFSQTRKMLNLIQDSLTSNGYSFLRIDGTTKAPDRLKIVNEFQEGLAPIFLLTSQVGGLGLTLTKADRVIVVDPAWNPSTDNQSVDRAYRIGQTKDVIVYRLMTSATVEEKIYRKQVYKGGLFKTATEHKEQIRYFSQQDLRELFSLPKGGFDVSPTQQQLHEEHYKQIKLDETLESHVKFLETLGIAGVSHHSLLFSKTAPVQALQEEEVEEIRRATSFAGRPSASSSQDTVIGGAEYAYKPKDVKPVQRNNISPIDSNELSESEIKARINRLSMLFKNKSTVSRLPDGGAKIQKQIAELTRELEDVKAAQNIDKSKPELIDLDELTERMHERLNL